MSYHLKIDIDAFKNIQETYEWYEMQLKGLGFRYKTLAKKQINSLKKRSLSFFDKIQ